MLRLLGKTLLAVFARLGARHVVVRRVLWIAGAVQFFLRRRNRRSHIVALRPGETLEVSLRSEIHQ